MAQSSPPLYSSPPEEALIGLTVAIPPDASGSGGGYLTCLTVPHLHPTVTAATGSYAGRGSPPAQRHSHCGGTRSLQEEEWLAAVGGVPPMGGGGGCRPRRSEWSPLGLPAEEQALLLPPLLRYYAEPLSLDRPLESVSHSSAAASSNSACLSSNRRVAEVDGSIVMDAALNARGLTRLGSSSEVGGASLCYPHHDSSCPNTVSGCSHAVPHPLKATATVSGTRSRGAHAYHPRPGAPEGRVGPTPELFGAVGTSTYLQHILSLGGAKRNGMRCPPHVCDSAGCAAHHPYGSLRRATSAAQAGGTDNETLYTHQRLDPPLSRVCVFANFAEAPLHYLVTSFESLPRKFQKGLDAVTSMAVNSSTILESSAMADTTAAANGEGAAESGGDEAKIFALFGLTDSSGSAFASGRRSVGEVRRRAATGAATTHADGDGNDPGPAHSTRLADPYSGGDPAGQEPWAVSCAALHDSILSDTFRVGYHTASSHHPSAAGPPPPPFQTSRLKDDAATGDRIAGGGGRRAATRSSSPATRPSSALLRSLNRLIQLLVVRGERDVALHMVMAIAPWRLTTSSDWLLVCFNHIRSCLPCGWLSTVTLAMEAWGYLHVIGASSADYIHVGQELTSLLLNYLCYGSLYAEILTGIVAIRHLIAWRATHYRGMLEERLPELLLAIWSVLSADGMDARLRELAAAALRDLFELALERKHITLVQNVVSHAVNCLVAGTGSPLQGGARSPRQQQQPATLSAAGGDDGGLSTQKGTPPSVARPHLTGDAEPHSKRVVSGYTLPRVLNEPLPHALSLSSSTLQQLHRATPPSPVLGGRRVYSTAPQAPLGCRGGEAVPPLQPTPPPSLSTPSTVTAATMSAGFPAIWQQREVSAESTTTNSFERSHSAVFWRNLESVVKRMVRRFPGRAMPGSRPPPPSGEDSTRRRPASTTNASTDAMWRAERLPSRPPSTTLTSPDAVPAPLASLQPAHSPSLVGRRNSSVSYNGQHHHHGLKVRRPSTREHEHLVQLLPELWSMPSSPTYPNRCLTGGTNGGAAAGSRSRPFAAVLEDIPVPATVEAIVAAGTLTVGAFLAAWGAMEGPPRGAEMAKPGCCRDARPCAAAAPHAAATPAAAAAAAAADQCSPTATGDEQLMERSVQSLPVFPAADSPGDRVQASILDTTVLPMSEGVLGGSGLTFPAVPASLSATAASNVNLDLFTAVHDSDSATMSLKLYSEDDPETRRYKLRERDMAATGPVDPVAERPLPSLLLYASAEEETDSAWRSMAEESANDYFPHLRPIGHVSASPSIGLTVKATLPPPSSERQSPNDGLCSCVPRRSYRGDDATTTTTAGATRAAHGSSASIEYFLPRHAVTALLSLCLPTAPSAEAPMTAWPMASQLQFERLLPLILQTYHNYLSVRTLLTLVQRAVNRSITAAKRASAAGAGGGWRGVHEPRGAGGCVRSNGSDGSQFVGACHWASCASVPLRSETVGSSGVDPGDGGVGDAVAGHHPLLTASLVLASVSFLQPAVFEVILTKRLYPLLLHTIREGSPGGRRVAYAAVGLLVNNFPSAGCVQRCSPLIERLAHEALQSPFTMEYAMVTASLWGVYHGLRRPTQALLLRRMAEVLSDRLPMWRPQDRMLTTYQGHRHDTRVLPNTEDDEETMSRLSAPPSHAVPPMPPAARSLASTVADKKLCFHVLYLFRAVWESTASFFLEVCTPFFKHRDPRLRRACVECCVPLLLSDCGPDVPQTHLKFPVNEAMVGAEVAVGVPVLSHCHAGRTHINTLRDVLHQLIEVAISDPEETIRGVAMRSFGPETYQFLYPHDSVIESLFIAINDRCLPNGVEAVRILRNLAPRNPPLVYPRLRLIFLQQLSDFMSKMKGHTLGNPLVPVTHHSVQAGGHATLTANNGTLLQPHLQAPTPTIEPESLSLLMEISKALTDSTPLYLRRILLVIQCVLENPQSDGKTVVNALRLVSFLNEESTAEDWPAFEPFVSLVARQLTIRDGNMLRMLSTLDALQTLLQSSEATNYSYDALQNIVSSLHSLLYQKPSIGSEFSLAILKLLGTISSIEPLQLDDLQLLPVLLGRPRVKHPLPHISMVLDLTAFSELGTVRRRMASILPDTARAALALHCQSDRFSPFTCELWPDVVLRVLIHHLSDYLSYTTHFTIDGLCECLHATMSICTETLALRRVALYLPTLLNIALELLTSVRHEQVAPHVRPLFSSALTRLVMKAGLRMTPMYPLLHAFLIHNWDPSSRSTVIHACHLLQAIRLAVPDLLKVHTELWLSRLLTALLKLQDASAGRTIEQHHTHHEGFYDREVKEGVGGVGLGGCEGGGPLPQVTGVGRSRSGGESNDLATNFPQTMAGSLAHAATSLVHVYLTITRTMGVLQPLASPSAVQSVCLNLPAAFRESRGYNALATERASPASPSLGWSAAHTAGPPADLMMHDGEIFVATVNRLLTKVLLDYMNRCDLHAYGSAIIKAALQHLNILADIHATALCQVMAGSARAGTSSAPSAHARVPPFPSPIAEAERATATPATISLRLSEGDRMALEAQLKELRAQQHSGFGCRVEENWWPYDSPLARVSFVTVEEHHRVVRHFPFQDVRTSWESFAEIDLLAIVLLALSRSGPSVSYRVMVDDYVRRRFGDGETSLLSYFRCACSELYRAHVAPVGTMSTENVTTILHQPTRVQPVPYPGGESNDPDKAEPSADGSGGGTVNTAKSACASAMVPIAGVHEDLSAQLESFLNPSPSFPMTTSTPPLSHEAMFRCGPSVGLVAPPPPLPAYLSLRTLDYTHVDAMTCGRASTKAPPPPSSARSAASPPLASAPIQLPFVTAANRGNSPVQSPVGTLSTGSPYTVVTSVSMSNRSFRTYPLSLRGSATALPSHQVAATVAARTAGPPAGSGHASATEPLMVEHLGSLGRQSSAPIAVSLPCAAESASGPLLYHRHRPRAGGSLHEGATATFSRESSSQRVPLPVQLPTPVAAMTSTGEANTTATQTERADKGLRSHDGPDSAASNGPSRATLPANRTRGEMSALLEHFEGHVSLHHDEWRQWFELLCVRIIELNTEFSVQACKQLVKQHKFSLGYSDIIPVAFLSLLTECSVGEVKDWMAALRAFYDGHAVVPQVVSMELARMGHYIRLYSPNMFSKDVNATIIDVYISDEYVCELAHRALHPPLALFHMEVSICKQFTWGKAARLMDLLNDLSTTFDRPQFVYDPQILQAILTTKPGTWETQVTASAVDCVHYPPFFTSEVERAKQALDPTLLEFMGWCSVAIQGYLAPYPALRDVVVRGNRSCSADRRPGSSCATSPHVKSSKVSASEDSLESPTSRTERLPLHQSHILGAIRCFIRLFDFESILHLWQEVKDKEFCYGREAGITGCLPVPPTPAAFSDPEERKDREEMHLRGLPDHSVPSAAVTAGASAQMAVEGLEHHTFQGLQGSSVAQLPTTFLSGGRAMTWPTTGPVPPAVARYVGLAAEALSRWDVVDEVTHYVLDGGAPTHDIEEADDYLLAASRPQSAPAAAVPLSRLPDTHEEGERPLQKQMEIFRGATQVATQRYGEAKATLAGVRDALKESYAIFHTENTRMKLQLSCMFQEIADLEEGIHALELSTLVDGSDASDEEEKAATEVRGRLYRQATIRRLKNIACRTLPVNSTVLQRFEMIAVRSALVPPHWQLRNVLVLGEKIEQDGLPMRSALTLLHFRDLPTESCDPNAVLLYAQELTLEWYRRLIRTLTHVDDLRELYSSITAALRREVTMTARAVGEGVIPFSHPRAPAPAVDTPSGSCGRLTVAELGSALSYFQAELLLLSVSCRRHLRDQVAAAARAANRTAALRALPHSPISSTLARRFPLGQMMSPISTPARRKARESSPRPAAGHSATETASLADDEAEEEEALLAEYYLLEHALSSTKYVPSVWREFGLLLFDICIAMYAEWETTEDAETLRNFHQQAIQAISALQKAAELWRSGSLRAQGGLGPFCTASLRRMRHARAVFPSAHLMLKALYLAVRCQESAALLGGSPEFSSGDWQRSASLPEKVSTLPVGAAAATVKTGGFAALDFSPPMLVHWAALAPMVVEAAAKHEALYIALRDMCGRSRHMLHQFLFHVIAAFEHNYDTLFVQRLDQLNRRSHSAQAPTATAAPEPCTTVLTDHHRGLVNEPSKEWTLGCTFPYSTTDFPPKASDVVPMRTETAAASTDSRAGFSTLTGFEQHGMRLGSSPVTLGSGIQSAPAVGLTHPSGSGPLLQPRGLSMTSNNTPQKPPPGCDSSLLVRSGRLPVPVSLLLHDLAARQTTYRDVISHTMRFCAFARAFSCGGDDAMRLPPGLCRLPLPPWMFPAGAPDSDADMEEAASGGRGGTSAAAPRESEVSHDSRHPSEIRSVVHVRRAVLTVPARQYTHEQVLSMAFSDGSMMLVHGGREGNEEPLPVPARRWDSFRSCMTRGDDGVRGGGGGDGADASRRTPFSNSGVTATASMPDPCLFGQGPSTRGGGGTASHPASYIAAPRGRRYVMSATLMESTMCALLGCLPLAYLRLPLVLPVSMGSYVAQMPDKGVRSAFPTSARAGPLSTLPRDGASQRSEWQTPLTVQMINFPSSIHFLYSSYEAHKRREDAVIAAEASYTPAQLADFAGTHCPKVHSRHHSNVSAYQEAVANAFNTGDADGLRKLLKHRLSTKPRIWAPGAVGQQHRYAYLSSLPRPEEHLTKLLAHLQELEHGYRSKVEAFHRRTAERQAALEGVRHQMTRPGRSGPHLCIDIGCSEDDEVSLVSLEEDYQQAVRLAVLRAEGPRYEFALKAAFTADASDTAQWVETRRTFTQELAEWSMLQYLLDTRQRECGSFFVDSASGHVAFHDIGRHSLQPLAPLRRASAGGVAGTLASVEGADAKEAVLSTAVEADGMADNTPAGMMRNLLRYPFPTTDPTLFRLTHSLVRALPSESPYNIFRSYAAGCLSTMADYRRDLSGIVTFSLNTMTAFAWQEDPTGHLAHSTTAPQAAAGRGSGGALATACAAAAMSSHISGSASASLVSLNGYGGGVAVKDRVNDTDGGRTEAAALASPATARNGPVASSHLPSEMTPSSCTRVHAALDGVDGRIVMPDSHGTARRTSHSTPTRRLSAYNSESGLLEVLAESPPASTAKWAVQARHLDEEPTAGVWPPAPSHLTAPRVSHRPQGGAGNHGESTTSTLLPPYASMTTQPSEHLQTWSNSGSSLRNVLPEAIADVLADRGGGGKGPLASSSPVLEPSLYHFPRPPSLPRFFDGASLIAKLVDHMPLVRVPTMERTARNRIRAELRRQRLEDVEVARQLRESPQPALCTALADPTAISAPHRNLMATVGTRGRAHVGEDSRKLSRCRSTEDTDNSAGSADDEGAASTQVPEDGSHSRSQRGSSPEPEGLDPPPVPQREEKPPLFPEGVDNREEEEPLANTAYDFVALLIKNALLEKHLLGTVEAPHDWARWAPHW